MAKSDYHKKYGDNQFTAIWKCGHRYPVYYNGKSSLNSRLMEAEKRLCPQCRDERLKKENEHIFVPWWYYKAHLENARNIVKGEYDPETKKIELWIPKKKAAEYMAEKLRRYFQPINTPVQNNRCTMKIIVKGNTEPIQRELRQLGAKWSERYHCWFFFDIDVSVEIDKRHNAYIPPESNPKYESLITKLKELKCIPDYSRINWFK